MSGLAEAIAAARAATDAGEAAVDAWDEAVRRLDASVPAEAQALVLDAAARASLRRAWTGGPPSDLDHAVDLWRRASRLVPAASGHRSGILSNLGVALRDVWERDGTPAVLDEAIAAGRAAVTAAATDAGAGAAVRLQLGRSLRERYGAGRRHEDLESAIAVLTGATAGGDREAYEALGNALYDRFARAGVAADLDAAVAQLRRAVALTPEDDPDATAYASNLASALLAAFESRGRREDLDEAVGLLDAAVAAEADPTSELLANAGNALRLRSGFDGGVADVERAVELLGRAAALARGDARRPGMLNSLAAGLLQRYDLTGRIEDVDRAVELLDDAVAATPPDDDARAGRLSNLGIALRTRRLRRGAGRADLDRAVTAFEQALAATANGDPDAAAQHANLGNALHQRFDVTNDTGDLERAVRHLEAALAATPHESPDRAGYLNNLGATLAARAVRTDDWADDLDRAVALTREAVRRCPPASAQRATFLVNLANAASERFERRGDAADLDEARAAYRSAVRAGLAASPAEALAAAWNWIAWARDRRDWREVAEAHHGGERAARTLFQTQLLRADKESWLRDAAGLTADGAYAFAALGRARDAAVAFERGRALLLSERLEGDDATLRRLAARHGSLAARFRDAAARVRGLEVTLAGKFPTRA